MISNGIGKAWKRTISWVMVGDNMSVIALAMVMLHALTVGPGQMELMALMYAKTLAVYSMHRNLRFV